MKTKAKSSKVSDRKFWRYVSQVKGSRIGFRIEYKKWLCKRSEIKQYVIEMYRKGWNQLQIAGVLMASPLKVRKILKESRKSLEWNIKNFKLLED